MITDQEDFANLEKKTLIAQQQGRPDVAEKWIQWRASKAHIDHAKVVFIDETWAKTNMARRHGRSLLGTRLVEKTPSGHWQTTTFLGALRAEGFIAPLTVEGATTVRCSVPGSSTIWLPS
jgi:hypothetical protein